jgi:hypothetical protein
MEESNTMTKEEMMAKVEFLKEQLSGDMFVDMDIKDEIHNLQMKIDGNKPMDTRIDCVGCGWFLKLLYLFHENNVLGR